MGSVLIESINRGKKVTKHSWTTADGALIIAPQIKSALERRF